MEIRPARPEDAPALFNLICALAEYEKLSHLVTGSADLLRHHLFGPEAFASALLAEVEGQAVGFALYFRHFSTFLTRPGLYLEDLFVLPEFRGRGIGKALLAPGGSGGGGQRIRAAGVDGFGLEPAGNGVLSALGRQTAP
jgi:GNAT superfamily N-acetyltransferase